MESKLFIINLVDAILAPLILFITIKSITKSIQKEGKMLLQKKGLWAPMRALLAFLFATLIAYVIIKSPIKNMKIPSPVLFDLMWLFPILVYVRFYEKKKLTNILKSISLRKTFYVVVIALFVCSILFVNILFMQWVIKPFNLKEVLQYLSHISSNAFLLYLIMSFSEEIIFRGFLQRRFLESMKPVYAIVSVALLFSFIHLLNYSAISLEVIYLCCGKIPIALILGYLMYRTDSILSVGIAHTFANFPKMIGGI